MIQRLINQPHRFTFFQAVRLLTASGGARDLSAAEGVIGTTTNASEESLRFVSAPTLEFPAAEVLKITAPPSLETAEQQADRCIEMEIAFWGIIGPVGVLPTHYTQLVIDRLRQRDDALHSFLGLFSHRQLSFFYRAWEKHFVPAGFERGQRGESNTDVLREALLSLVGRGTSRIRDQLDVLDDVCIYYGGLFIDRPNAESLGTMIGDYLGLATRVLSLFGSWLRFPESEQSRLGMSHVGLGVDTVIGERIWDPASKFRVRIGPVDYASFRRLMPGSQCLQPTCQLVRSYVGCEYLFDIQVVLQANEIPPCKLGHPDPQQGGASLGWNTWLCSKTPSEDRDDAVFQHDGAPSAVAT